MESFKRKIKKRISDLAVIAVFSLVIGLALLSVWLKA